MDFYRDVYEIQDDPAPDGSHGWIQWKGTQVCMDIHCVCGAHGHIDADFFYHYECVACGRKFAVGQHVRLIELTPEQVAYVEGKGGIGFEKDEQLLMEMELEKMSSPSQDTES